MLEHLHYSYTILLSYYTFAILLLGTLAGLSSHKVASAMRLFGLLGLLTLNVSSTYLARMGLMRSIEFPLEFLRLLRIILLCWLPWVILSLGADMLEVRWHRIRRSTMVYSTGFSLLYLLLQLGRTQTSAAVTIEYMEIAIYLMLALFAIIIPIVCLKLGVQNTLSQNFWRHWYRETVSTMLLSALSQLLAFIPLYLSYFPSILNLRNYAEADIPGGIALPPLFGSLNFMPIYYLFFSLPFLCHILYIFKNGLSPQVTTEKSQSNILSTLDNQRNESNKKIINSERLSKFATNYAISKREQEVLCELISGRSYAAIAEKLYISLATVKSHIYSIYRKTEVKNKIQLLSKILNE